MLKILILCKSLSTTKKIANKILCDLEEIKIVGIANELNESKELILKTEPDFIISTTSSIIEFLENNINFYTPKVIIISRSSEIYTDNKTMLILNYNMKFSEMSKYISKFIRQDISISKKDKVRKELSNLGFNFKLCGTIYLFDSILYSSTYKGYYSFEKLKRDIYSHVAELNNSTPDRVKWSIARSINYMFQKHTLKSYEVVEKYFGIKYPKKPTPKLVISRIANNLD